jgi:hypothetical protein
MAQSTLHFAFGIFIGSLATLAPVWREWRHGRPVAQRISRWCLISYAFGLYAVLPAIIRRLADDPELGRGPWWNLFLFYPLIDHLRMPSIACGELAAAVLFMLQFGVIALAIRRARAFGDSPNEGTCKPSDQPED